MSAVPAATIIPPGQHAPFATVTDDDHRAWIIVSAAMGVSFTLLTLLVRVLSRLYVNRGWALDDTFAVMSTLFSWVQASLILAACASGLGKSIELIPLSLHVRIQQLYYASNLLYLCALDLSKVSVVLFLRRILSPGSRELQYNTVVLVLLPISTLAFILAAALQCDLSRPWIIIHQKCPSWFLRWEIHGVFASLFEVGIFSILVLLVWKLQMKVQLKVEILISFALRLVILPFTGIRLGSFDTPAFSTNPTLREASYICWTQTELSFAVIAATIPTARKLVLDLITYYNGGGFGSSTRLGTGAGGTEGENYEMKSLQMLGSRNSKGLGHTGSVHASRAVRDADNDSQEMIIKNEVTVDVADSPREFQ